MKNVIHVVSSLQTGGAEKFVVNLALQQMRDGLNVSVFSYGESSDPLAAPLRHANITVRCAGDLKLSRWSLAQTLATADVVHIHSPAVIRALAPAFLPLLKSRVIYTVHGKVDPDQSLLGLTHQIARLYLSKVTAVSEEARQSLRSRYGWSPNSVRTIANGIAMPPAPLPHGRNSTLRLGTVSRLVALKNIPLLFEAISLLPADFQARIEVVVVGDGPEQARISAARAALPNLNCVLTGNLTAEEDIYGRFDVLVNCSDTEGLPMSIIEAMGYGRPVIATAVGALPATVQDGSTGWLYPPRDAPALAAIIRKLLDRPELIAAAGSAARNYALENHGIDVVARQFEEIYATRDEA
jgi:glycosyltransferase involved in cell wall biosynthesis